jgi:hypothetical protein
MRANPNQKFVKELVNSSHKNRDRNDELIPEGCFPLRQIPPTSAALRALISLNHSFYNFSSIF